MSAALEKSVRARFAAAVAWGRKGSPARVHAILETVNGPQDGSRQLRVYTSADPNGPFLTSEQSAQLTQALDALDARLDALATDAAETLRQFAALFIPDPETRAEVLDDPRTANAAQGGDAFLDALHAAAIEHAAGLPAPTTIDLETLGPDGVSWREVTIHVGATWPGDVARDDVLAWLESRKHKEAAAAFRKALDAGVNQSDPRLQFRGQDGARLRVLTLAGAAVLFSVERSILDDPLRARRPFAILADTSPASRVSVQSLAAVDVREHGPREVQKTGAIVSRISDGETLGVSIIWKKPGRRLSRSTETELQLRLPGVEWTMLDAVLSATREEYGVEVAATLLGVSAFSFLQGKRAGDSVLLYPEELARATGRRDDKEYRKRLRGWFDALASARIVTRFRGGTDLDEPLVAVLGQHGSRAIELRLARVLFRGVRQDSGEPGNYWCPAPVALLAAGPRALMLPVLLGPSFRLTRDDPRATIGEVELANRLGIYSRATGSRGDRRIDRRQLDTLDDTLAAAEAAGFLAPVERSGNGADPLLTLRPSAAMLSIMETGAVPRTTRLPETGADLAGWLEYGRRRHGWTDTKAAEELGLDRATLWRAMKEPELALPVKVRGALRRRLWGSAW